jgi:hypothetical protein
MEKLWSPSSTKSNIDRVVVPIYSSKYTSPNDKKFSEKVSVTNSRRPEPLNNYN